MISNREIMFYDLPNEELEKNIRISFNDITCFYNRDMAIEIVNEILNMHSEEIAQWLWEDSSDSRRRIRLDSSHQYPIGYGISQRTKQKYTDLTKSYIILEKSGFSEEGFYIIFTAPLIEYNE
ncbi:RNase A-like domain-containing protein [Lysinibacillus sp. NPDC093190]|uniref:RNase A-like domain-containing protein n=1 Tax=Lysinibacillus sp. NPDC093190 TaxID=3390575 RepID=UPI003D080402